MEMDVYLKTNADGTPWKAWAIGSEDGKLYVRFGPHEVNNDGFLRLRSFDQVAIKSTLNEEFSSRVTAKLNEGYKAYEETRYDIDDDGVLRTVATSPVVAQLFNKPYVYVSGEVSPNIDSSVLDGLKSINLPSEVSVTFTTLKSKSILLTLAHPEYQEFVLTVRLTGQKGKVTAQYDHKHSPYTGLFLLYIYKQIDMNKLGSIEFADTDTNEILMGSTLKSDVLNKFNPSNLDDFKNYASDVGVIRKPLNFSSFAPNYSNQVIL